MMDDLQIMQAADRFGTPLYLFDLDCARSRIRQIREGLADSAGDDIGRISLTYSMKTNPFLTGTMADLADRIEVCSMGEFRICRALRIPPERLFISGVLKLREDLAEILDYGTDRARYTAESPQQARYLSELAAARGFRVRVYPRLTNGSQFGMDEGTILRMIREADTFPGIAFAGIHFFSGTQKKRLAKHARELAMLDAFFARLREEAGWDVPELEYGTGFAYTYFEDQKKGPDLCAPEHLAAFRALLAEMRWRGAVTIEMGRAFAAPCGYYVTTVCDCKASDGRDICIVDGGIHQLQYDGQIKGMYRPQMRVLPGREADRQEGDQMICGSLCTMNDVLCGSWPGDIREGDRLVFLNTGAYSFYEGMSLFLSHELPAVVLCSEERGFEPARAQVQTWPLNMPRQ